jgi:hypothetical protein
MKRWGLLAAFSGAVFAQSFYSSTWSGTGPSSMAGIRFETRTEPPMPVSPFIGSSSGRTFFGPTGGYAATHRFFRDDSTLTYFGYDLMIEPDTQPDTYKLSFFDLAIGPLDFGGGRVPTSKPSDWKKLPLPALPATQTAHAGDRIDVPVWIDATTGQKVIDVVIVQSAPQFPASITVANGMMTGRVFSMPLGAPGRGREVPTVSGTAREFKVEDAEMHLMQPRVTINGESNPAMAHGGSGATGTLVWFYVPKHGRYVLSLAPRPELGFAKCGEVRGGSITFKIDSDDVALETFTPIAPGSSPYVLYVLHDKEWEPTARNQTSQLQYGSVSPAELAALMK